MTYTTRWLCLLALIFAGQHYSNAQNIYTVAGTGGPTSGDGGPATAAGVVAATVAIDPSGNLYINQYGYIRKVSATTGIITTFAGIDCLCPYSGDGGPATAAQFDGIEFIASDASGNIYLTDLGNQRVRMVNTAGIVSTVAGNGSWGYSGDGHPATAAELDFPNGLWVDAAGNIYISEYDSRC